MNKIVKVVDAKYLVNLAYFTIIVALIMGLVIGLLLGVLL